MDPNETIDDIEAAAILEVSVDRIDVMVADGLLGAEPDDGAGRRFSRAEVEALRHLGG